MDNQKSGRIQNDSDDDDQQNMYSWFCEVLTPELNGADSSDKNDLWASVVVKIQHKN